MLMICGIDPADVSQEDKSKLHELGFFVGTDFGEDAFLSYKYGSG